MKKVKLEQKLGIFVIIILNFIFIISSYASNDNNHGSKSVEGKEVIDHGSQPSCRC